MQSKAVGNLGEDLACEYLVKKRYKILGRNYRITFGEIDVVAKKKGLFADKTIHFVEVKALSSTQGFFPEDHVNEKKREKLRRLAELWLAKHRYPENHSYQIDIIAVEMRNKNITFFENTVDEKRKLS